jgi:hypothetical protein
MAASPMAAIQMWTGVAMFAIAVTMSTKEFAPVGMDWDDVRDPSGYLSEI